MTHKAEGVTKKRIGLIVGYEWSWPYLFIQEVQRRDKSVVVEYVPFAGTRLSDVCEYDLILDRSSQGAGMLRSYLKAAILQGVHVINNTFTWELDDKFHQAALARQIGIHHPKTVLLPNKDYWPQIDHQNSLRNLVYPLPWQAHVEYLGGFPLILKDVSGWAGNDVFVIDNLEQLYQCYDKTGTQTMILQEYIRWEQYARCICFAQETVLVSRYDPNTRQYLAPDFSPALMDRLIAESLKLTRALDMDLMSIEWALQNDTLYAIDFLNYNPDFDVAALGFDFQRRCIAELAKMSIEFAYNPKAQRTPFSFHQKMESPSA